MLAITTLGRTWTLNDTTNVGYGAFTSEGGQAGNYTQTSGALGYNEVSGALRGSRVGNVNMAGVLNQRKD